ncbi:MAG: GxxExxY protein [Patescibacteria group bacterium]
MEAKRYGAKLIHPELSYTVVGVCFDAQNDIGRYGREKQYADAIEKKFQTIGIPYRREVRIGDSGDIADFLIDGKILLELKAKRTLTKEDYFQVQRYLQSINVQLGLLVNFRSRYLYPKRIVRISNFK